MFAVLDPCDNTPCFNGGNCVATSCTTAMCECEGCWTGTGCTQRKQSTFNLQDITNVCSFDGERLMYYQEGDEKLTVNVTDFEVDKFDSKVTVNK